jgi:hypothetical protein
MNKFIVITSIFNPTEAVIAFAKKNDYQTIVVGDKKTPEGWYCENVDFLSVTQQENMNFQLMKHLPYNHYCRKMLGYLKAITCGADYIVDTDDDNIPKENWTFPVFQGNFDCVNQQGFINIYELYTSQKIWPRGFPLNHITKKNNFTHSVQTQVCKIGIWQGLADEDPDVDAIYRLTSDQPCCFKERNPVALGIGAISPFNTQNTMIIKELFPLMYLPAYVTFRFTDILRGLVAQPIMWLYGYQLGFTNATVVQKRNPHDYMKDFLSEIPMYQYSEKVADIVSNHISGSESIETNLYNAYKALLNENIVCEKELEMLAAWLADIQLIEKNYDKTSKYYDE